MAQTGTTQISALDPRQFWNDTFDLLCQATFQELASQSLSRRWHYIDTTTSVFVSATASGSAVAGWALWSSPGGKVIWLTIAGLSSVLSLMHSTLQVPSKMKLQDEVAHVFFELRIEIQQFRQQIRHDVRAGLVSSGAKKSYDDFYDRYTESMKRVPSSVVVTDRLRRRVQDAVERMLESDIRENKPS